MIDACIFNIQRYSLHDGNGIRTIVFFKGCPFHCPWCSNPESLSPKPELSFRPNFCIHCKYEVNGICNANPTDCVSNAREWVGSYQSIDDIMNVVDRDRIFYDTSGGGITLSGGECLWQETFVTKLLQRCKAENIHTAIETTLATKIKNIEQLVHVTDEFLVDFKIMDEAKSKAIIGIDLSILKHNIDNLLKLHATIIPRIPLIPGFTISDENIIDIIQYLKAKNLMTVHLLPFHKLGEVKYRNLNKEYHLNDLESPSEQVVKDIKLRFIKNGFKTVIGGN